MIPLNWICQVFANQGTSRPSHSQHTHRPLRINPLALIKVASLSCRSGAKNRQKAEQWTLSQHIGVYRSH